MQDLAAWVSDARARTLELVADLTDEQMMGPRLAIVNPLRWEIGHVAWFQEKWVLRHVLGRQPLLANADALYDSSAIPHDVRWDLPLPSRSATVDNLCRTRDLVLATLQGGEPTAAQRYFNLLSTFHEDMHDEAFTYTRQTLGCCAPTLSDALAPPPLAGPLPGDAKVPGGRFPLGAVEDGHFVFDNEKWATPVEVAPFSMARAPVTQAEFASFVDAGGYQTSALWTEEGWQWRQEAHAEGHLYWRKVDGQWQRRDFDRWVALEPHRPVIHVNWHEAQAFCRWAARRLPSEAEWEMAASWDPTRAVKRRYPWGDQPPTAQHANLDAVAMGCVDVGALPAGDSPYGFRQMMGNVWEWTSSAFGPYPGFVADPYKDYSEPWFHGHKVLRGGCWVTRGRLLRNTWRNFYPPHRRDVWGGFRTCAL